MFSYVVNETGFLTSFLHVRFQVAARRITTLSTSSSTADDGTSSTAYNDCIIPLDEFKQVMIMPKFNAEAAAIAVGDAPTDIVVPIDIENDLRDLVAIIAASYKSADENPFHNFDHACHVTMSVSKLIKRIVRPDISNRQLEAVIKSNMNKNRGGVLDNSLRDQQTESLASQLHDYTNGLTSDPMTIFAIVFSALIHDVDHQGISNTQLCKEDPVMANKYHSKSVAEQNSIDISWEIFMLDQFTCLRNFIFGADPHQHDVELRRFRQVIVNVVLATDIFDKDLNDLRKRRWNQAFSSNATNTSMTSKVNDFRATIVMEHIIQASDVSHTMQHWHVYIKWNTRLFKEMYASYQAGRMGSKDPSTFWYHGELSFFDNYIIPLAKKLEECNVFGVSSDEYLNYALLNRAEWEVHGQDIVNQLVQEVLKTSVKEKETIGSSKADGGGSLRKMIHSSPSSSSESAGTVAQ